MERLRKYLKQIMKERDLKKAQIERQSRGAITDSYLADILSGKTKHISVEKLEALALGLQMDSVELFKIVTGHTPADDTSQDLAAIFRIVLDMNPKERAVLLASLRKKK